MKVVVDTSIWSLAFRRKTISKNPTIKKLEILVAQGRVALLGTVRQEILSGIRYQEQFKKLQERLRAFPDLNLEMEDYELAANYFNVCRKNGVQASNTDFLICAAANRRSYEVFTADKDFISLQKQIPIVLI